jgi:nucleotide-binding universal stress UspA family protein
MVTSLLDRPLVPVADPDDAAATYEELRPYLLETEIVPIVVHAVEKAGGAPDKASVEQRKEHAEKTFEAFRKWAEIDGVEVDTKLLYGTDIAATIVDAADEAGASAIVFRSRGDSQWIDLVSGRVRSKLLDSSNHPVVVLPKQEVES